MTTMRISVTILLLVGMALANIHKKCHDGFSRHGHHCFQFFAAAKTWGQAEQACQALGGNLASVHNTEEYNFVQDLIKKSAPSRPETWLGGTNAVELKMWLWSDGSKFNWVNWCQGEPNNEGGNEHCLTTNGCGAMKWNDIGCSKSLPYVCAKRI